MPCMCTIYDSLLPRVIPHDLDVHDHHRAFGAVWGAWVPEANLLIGSVEHIDSLDPVIAALDAGVRACYSELQDDEDVVAMTSWCLAAPSNQLPTRVVDLCERVGRPMFSVPVVAAKSSLELKTWIADNLEGLWAKTVGFGTVEYHFYKEEDAVAFSSWLGV